MNNRTRQWLKAQEMLNKHDPLLMCSVGDGQKFRQLMFVRQSKLEDARKKYGNVVVII